LPKRCVDDSGLDQNRKYDNARQRARRLRRTTLLPPTWTRWWSTLRSRTRSSSASRWAPGRSRGSIATWPPQPGARL